MRINENAWERDSSLLVESFTLNDGIISLNWYTGFKREGTGWLII